MNRAGAFQVVADFEAALAAYTGAPHVVSVDSCTNAIFLSLLWVRRSAPEKLACLLPRRTYVGVAQAARNAGYGIEWSDEPWTGAYQIGIEMDAVGGAWCEVIDSAKRLRAGMFGGITGQHVYPVLACVSFQAGKLLPIGRGGAILTDSAEAAQWLRRARFDGRTPGDDAAPIQTPGYHVYMDPPSAARGLWLLSWLPKDNPDLPSDEYDDLSQMECFGGPAVNPRPALPEEFCR